MLFGRFSLEKGGGELTTSTRGLFDRITLPFFAANFVLGGTSFKGPQNSKDIPLLNMEAMV